MLKVTEGEVPQALYEARKQEYEIAVNQAYDSQTRKPRNPNKSHHPPCAEVEGAVLTSRAQQYSTLLLRLEDAETRPPRHTLRDHTLRQCPPPSLTTNISYNYNRTHNNCEI